MRDFHSPYPPGIVVRANIYLPLSSYPRNEYQDYVNKFKSMHKEIFLSLQKEIQDSNFNTPKLTTVTIGKFPRCNLSFQTRYEMKVGMNNDSKIHYFTYNKPSTLYKMNIQWVSYLYEEHLPVYSRMFFDKHKEPFPRLTDESAINEMLNLINIRSIENEINYIFCGRVQDMYVVTIKGKKLFLDKIKVSICTETELVYACENLLEQDIPEGKAKFNLPQSFQEFQDGIDNMIKIRKEMLKK